MLVRMCSNKKKYIVGQNLLVDTLTGESSLLASQVEWVSTLDLSVLFHIYPRVLVLKIWLWDLWGLPRFFHGVFEVRTIFIRFIGLLNSHSGTVDFSRGYITYDKIITLTANGMCICVFMCFRDRSVLISVTFIITHLNQAFWGSLILKSEP